ncbi:DUF3307 domain-containing protein [Pedobacter frigoris]|uniref:DUF3307 domain-containing protein n=1 Tax=Pedobacter frigoris TaxID=2571272 RepID=A0A4V5P212_9SPHI|nr:DUF3307 domain-containing protein [Pedobacter frigoris]TKC09592.1 DUF3307 domain-containing protein [Pedobacter frigoris]
MEINLLLRLVIAHLLTDFVLQPKSWVTDREQKKGKSFKLYIHVIITTIVAYLFSGLYDNVVIPLVIFSTHLLIDYIKSKANKDKFRYFIADQLAHLLVIITLWLSIENIWVSIPPFANELFSNTRFWVVSAGYLFVSWPLGIIIGKATQKWRDQISREKEKLALENKNEEVTEENQTATLPEIIKTTEEQELGLASAGKWIGICERILILTFVLMAQYTAIGFLMTAKSILRFSEKEANTQLKTEYVLVGTLVSFASSAMIGVLINLILK